MIRDYIVKAATLLLFVGFASGLVGQVELMRPGISFISPELWTKILPVHVWAMIISTAVIVLSTISLIGDRTILGQWAIWLGFSTIALLCGALLNLALSNVQSPDSFITDTYFITANRHAYGTALLLVALGGLSALQKVKFESLPLKTSFVFALLVTSTGIALAFLQSQLGLYGLPRQYIDYPNEFASLQLYSSIAAITCCLLSVVYIIILWHHSNKKVGTIEEVF
ncbi:heme-copper oxidase family protein [Hellea balneolensis]|uniref:hypothetical protein n=1 Tax=Hellea balneolensis TaxID=287478 RepID=UPI000479E06A|nr:hypothetical protein [Hellea balneolensis]